jgi:ATP-dependent RNA helicase DeaD
MGLKPEILQGLEDMGFENPMPVQEAVFDPFVAGRDLQVQARTGTGKTAGFGIPITTMIDWASSGLQALILAPTRELGLQVAREIEAIAKHTDLRVVPVYGGAPMKPQIDALAAGAQIVAGTPGRVLDHLRRGTMKAGGLKFLVLDECDEMLSMGFQEEIENIISFLPKKEERQTLLFSATIPDEIQRIARRHLTDPENVILSSDDDIAATDVDHFYYVVSGMARTRDLLRVLRAERPESALIFCNTREDTNTVAKFMCRHGYDAEPISSDLTQRDRERVMKRMRDKTLPFLVATDVAARGIDISDLTHVINYTFPESAQVYVHRTGRTGRAGKKGIALSLVGPREIGSFYYLKLIYKIRPKERDLPTMEELATMEEGHRYEKVVELVPEQPTDEFVSLARRVWQSNEGERVVAALLQRLLSRKAAPAAAPAPAPAPAVKSEATGEEDTVSSERGPRRERSRRRRSERGRKPREERTDTAAPDDTVRVERVDTEEETVDGVDKRRKRRRRRRGGGNGGAKAVSDAAASVEVRDEWEETNPTMEGNAKEFWEAWADDKNPAATARPDKPDGEEAGDEAAPKPKAKAKAKEEPATPGQVRLYVNLGKREEMTDEDLRTAIVEWLGEDPGDNLGRITLRNTHCYVRVDESIADALIEKATGQTYKEREVVVERARK